MVERRVTGGLAIHRAGVIMAGWPSEAAENHQQENSEISEDHCCAGQ